MREHQRDNLRRLRALDWAKDQPRTWELAGKVCIWTVVLAGAAYLVVMVKRVVWG